MVAQHRRIEASDTGTSPERLHELIGLPGNRGDIDSDSGWCRENVASNPTASPETLTELAGDATDFLVRSRVASNPSTPIAVLELLSEDTNFFVANTARAMLGKPIRTVRYPNVLGPMRVTAFGTHSWSENPTGPEQGASVVGLKPGDARR